MSPRDSSKVKCPHILKPFIYQSVQEIKDRVLVKLKCEGPAHARSVPDLSEPILKTDLKHKEGFAV